MLRSAHPFLELRMAANRHPHAVPPQTTTPDVISPMPAIHPTNQPLLNQPRHDPQQGKIKEAGRHAGGMR
ncbi:hypothetical protein BS50DRAFT_253454 [Corynespora cassiicola Philippines]|uniref:Uncharacterized protein n=1 Tax=Corynespora cassiicola Philippines TaxID=1448308 RepID=A0A2T2P494_CORCC|nr:hypothetical protein BS50DRAFT_253454 [Corynespora cassiicola Philippines]